MVLVACGGGCRGGDGGYGIEIMMREMAVGLAGDGGGMWRYGEYGGDDLDGIVAGRRKGVDISFESDLHKFQRTLLIEMRLCVRQFHQAGTSLGLAREKCYAFGFARILKARVVVACGGGCRGGDGGDGMEMITREVVWWYVGDGGEMAAGLAEDGGAAWRYGDDGGDDLDGIVAVWWLRQQRAAKVAVVATGGRNVEEGKWVVGSYEK
uniref:Uncharacterized protein n=1 Tax=Tanacetum cinerariifolium TaxID=118510 RepID=A0A699HTR9_TANCI|nr:hypothetical protein [Tanacetum cinerariifolium]